MSAVAIIPARGGSKRIPRKNFREFHGRPILAYSVDAALESGLFDGGVWVSAEEQDWGEIGVAAPQAGWVKRYPEFAGDLIGTQEVTRHALQVMEGQSELERRAIGERRPSPEYVCCIYATAPLLTPRDLRNGYHNLVEHDYQYVYIEGWYYWGRASDFLTHPELDGARTLRIEVPERWVDINVEADWLRAEQMYARLHMEKST